MMDSKLFFIPFFSHQLASKGTGQFSSMALIDTSFSLCLLEFSTRPHILIVVVLCFFFRGGPI